MRRRVPRSAFGEWKPESARDPLGLLAEQEKSRIAELLPLRHERMAASPFAFYRGAAVVMAADLATLPVTGLRVQVCGDAHIANFGGFGTPERDIIFDVNDFDETLPGWWEWDVLRMAASVVLAARTLGFSTPTAKRAVREGVRTYRRGMLRFATLSPVNVWYERIELRELTRQATPAQRRDLRRHLKQSEASTARRLLPKLTAGEQPRFVDESQTFRRIGLEGDVAVNARTVLKKYRESLLPHVRTLIDRFTLRDMAQKVVGVGSVGTLCLVALFMTEKNDPLILQLKEADASVLESHLGRSPFKNHGERVVHGQHLMQAASDIFLGWTTSEGKDFYVRQLRDMKISIDLTSMLPDQLVRYARFCGWTLARAHARSGDPCAIAAYLGESDRFETSVGRFARTYADVTEGDYNLFVKKAHVPEGKDDALTS